MIVKEPIVTCNAKNYTTKGNPCFLAASPEVSNYVPWIKSTQYTPIICEEVVQSNTGEEVKPDDDYWGK